jgi:hypothetical protein
MKLNRKELEMARIYLGNVKGPKGDTGATGATGPQGEAATIEVGSVSTTAYGNAAQVTNVGSSSAAKFNFVIPQGKPGEKTTKMGELTLDTITTSEDSFPSPSVGDSGATAFGKIVKWFADGLAALTSKLDANKVVDSQAVTEDGYALSAKQANPNISGSLAAQISTLNDSLSTFFPAAWSSNVNLNNLNTPGIYMLSTGISNYPVNDHPWSPIIVFGAAGNYRQILFLTSGDVWIRAYDSTWGAWKKFTMA